jgi:hypothetical protein
MTSADITPEPDYYDTTAYHLMFMFLGYAKEIYER